MAKSNFEKVESVVGWVRDKKITGYRISKETNAREMSIIALAQGRAKVKNISFETALGLIDFMTKIIKNSKINLLFQLKTRECALWFFSMPQKQKRYKKQLASILVSKLFQEISVGSVEGIPWSVLLLDC